MLQSCRSIGIYNKNGISNNSVSCQRIINIVRNVSTTPSTPSTPPSIPALSQPTSSSSSSSIPTIKPLRFFDHPSGKHKTPKKRASKILHILQNEEFEKLKNNRQFPNVEAGDSVSIEKLPFMSSTEPDIIKGVVIAKVNRSSDTALTVLNVEHGTPVVRRIVMYNPLVQSIKILQKAFIHEGKKRVRRSKLYYLMNRDPEEYTVK